MTLVQLLAADTAAFSLLAGLFGLIVGSFLNVVIYRLPIMMERSFRQECAALDDTPDQATELSAFNLMVPRSRCPSCGHQITAIENIPVISYLFLRGKCRNCKTPISFRYPAIELLTGLLSAGIAWHFGFGLAALGGIVLSWALICLFFIDADTYLLPDAITLPLLWLGLLINLSGTFTSLSQAVLGAVAGYLLLWSVYWCFKLLTGKEGMGYGDFKLLAALGAWFGLGLLPMVILFASVAGVVMGIGLTLFSGRAWAKPLPFGPYLAVAGLLAMLWGPRLMAWYLGAA